MQLGLPALAGSIAVCFSHPLELTKVFDCVLCPLVHLLIVV